MKRKTVVILSLIAAFAVLVGVALWRELQRDADAIAHSISGRLDVDPRAMDSGEGDINRTDRVALILVDMETRHPVAIHFESPLVPPLNFRISAQDAQDGKPLTGHYQLIAITDKDGEVFRAVPGELYGQGSAPVAIGDQQVVIALTEPFRGNLFNQGMAAGPFAGGPGGGPFNAQPGPPERTISGTVSAAPEVAGTVTPGDRLIILLFDPELGRPAAVSMAEVTKLPQAFSISIPPGQPLKSGYSLRILTDKDNNPFGAAPGEIVGRSGDLVKPGTKGLKFVMDQPYVR